MESAIMKNVSFLHKIGLVHRDLKLDNCGLDHQQQGKIFDLGSVTSEPGDVLGTIFTRAPELFLDGAKCDNISDVWALGATLLALRSGDYPFVDKSEIEERRLINLQLRDGLLSESDAQERKRAIDSKVRERITRGGAELELTEKVHGTLRGRSKDILLSMLKFERSERQSVEKIEGAWSLLAREFAGSVGPAVVARSKWDQIKIHLRAVTQNETQLTTKQLDKIISDYEADKLVDVELSKDLELGKLIRQVKERVSLSR
jgi:serine/threonine protein kinase